MTTMRSMVLAALGLFMLLGVAAPQPAAALTLTDGATVQSVYWHRHWHRHHHRWHHYGFDGARTHQA